MYSYLFSLLLDWPLKTAGGLRFISCCPLKFSSYRDWVVFLDRGPIDLSRESRVLVIVVPNVDGQEGLGFQERATVIL